MLASWKDSPKCARAFALRSQTIATAWARSPKMTGHWACRSPKTTLNSTFLPFLY
jgi:hypothetical protein